MREVNGTDVRDAAAEMVRTLRPHAAADWSVPARGLEWDCRATAAHVAHDLLAYAGQLAALPDDGYLPMDLTVRPQAAVAQVLQVVTAAAGLLGAALDQAAPGARAWHWGPCDPSGFAALGVVETLVHTTDITGGLGIPWQPPAELSALALYRLFPDAPPGEPGAVLLWCTGRTALGALPRRASWNYRVARSA